VGQLSLFDVIPPSKSLSSTGNRTGLPIGNYTSQFFANVYLDRLDQFAKHQLKIKYYIRYVDDLVLVHENPRQLEAWEGAMGSFVESELSLRLHPCRRKLEPVSNGCDFLGYVVRRTHLLPRRRTIQNCREKLRQHQKLLVTRTQTTIYRYPEREVSQLFATLMSYQGQFRHAASFRIWRKIFDEFPYLRFYVKCSSDSWIRNDGTPRRFGSLAAQYRWFASRFTKCLMFFQVGCFFEFYLAQTKKVRALLPLKKGRRRRSLGAGAGLPVRCARLTDLARTAALPLVVVRQTGKPAGNTAQRRLSMLLMK
jgi:hypothetical protein